MIILSSTSDKIQVSLDRTITTNQMQCFASYRDTTTTTIEAKRNITLTNNTSQVDLVDSPSASTQRVVDYFSIYNNDTVVNSVTVRFFDGSNGYRLMVTRLLPDEKLEYQDGEGFRIISNGGGEKTVSVTDVVTSPSGLNVVVLENDYVNSFAVGYGFTGALNYGIPVKKDKIYWYRFIYFYDSNVTTNGCRPNVAGPSSIRLLPQHSRQTNGAANDSNIIGLTIYTPAATSNYLNAAATTANFGSWEGFIQPDVDGFLFYNFGGELASPNSITLKENSIILFQQLL